MTNRRRWLILALLFSLALSLLFISPAQAHGGEGDELRGPAAAWLVVLIYLELALIPVAGVWLISEALAAWRPRHTEIARS